MDRTRATFLILLGAVGMSFAALFVRLVDQADGFQILTYRSITLAAMVALMACARRRVGPLGFLRSLDRTDAAIGLTLALAFACYVFALLNTSVASVLFILSAAPFLAAVLGWVWINERPAAIVWATMSLAVAGILIMVSGATASGQTLGNLLAILSAAFFACMLVMVRKNGHADVLGGTFLGGVFACVLAAGCALVFGDGLAVSGYDLGITLFMGAFTIGLGIGLVTWGTPFVPAAEVSLLVLLESVLSPVWVWIFLGETITWREIAGGSLVFLAVATVAVVRGQRRVTPS